MGFIHLIQSLTRHRLVWILLFLLGVVLESCGLYFQYGLRMDPCVYCVYERAFYMSFIIAGLVGFLYPNFFLFRQLATLTFLTGSAGGLYVAFEHLTSVYQTGFGATCKLKASYPSFMPLDEWLPWMFSPTASCSPLGWELFGFSMPEWIFVSFATGLVVASLFLLSEFFKRKRNNYTNFYR